MNNNQQNDERTKTLTNPRLSVKIDNVEDTCMKFSHVEGQICYSPIRESHQRKINCPIGKFRSSENKMLRTHVQESPQIGKQSSFVYQGHPEQFKSMDDHGQPKLISENDKDQAFILKHEQKDQYYVQRMDIQENLNFKHKNINLTSFPVSNLNSHLGENRQGNVFIRRQTKQQSHRNKAPLLATEIKHDIDIDYQMVSEESDCSEDQDFMLSCADLNKRQIMLTLQERILKSPSHRSNPQFNQNSTNKDLDEIKCQANPSDNQIINNHSKDIDIDSIPAQKQPINQKPLTNIKQITISLNQMKQFRQLRRFTPIKSLKKYILSKFGYSQGFRNCQKLQLSFYNLYPNQLPQITCPITNEQNLQIILSEYLKARKNLFICFENDGSLNKKIQRKTHKADEYQVRFDSDGQLEESEDESHVNNEIQIVEGEQSDQRRLIKVTLKVNKTEKSKYRGPNLVRCSFCQKSNKDIESIKTCGPFYGPFNSKRSTKYYCHLLCALWCKKVFLNDNLELMQIPSQINRSKRKLCDYCDNSGAGLLCHTCNASMHYQCGLGRCQYLWGTYQLYCQRCAERNRLQIQENIEDEKEENEKEEGDQEEYEQYQNQKMEIQKNYISQNVPIMQIQPDCADAVKMEAYQVRDLSIGPFLNFHSNQSVFFSSQLSQSRTISIKNANQKQAKLHYQELSIDPGSRIDFNSESVEILEGKHKPAKNKMHFQVKIQEPFDASSSSEKRRGRNPKR